MTATIAAPKVSSSDRISFTLLFAIALHALIILGLGFELIKNHSSPPSTIEVILTKTQNVDAPEDAKVIAEHNQVQSGSVDFDARPTSPSVTKKALQGNDQTSSTEMTKNTTRAAENELMLHQNDPDGEKFSRRITNQENSKIDQKQLRKNQQNVAQLVSELSREKQLYAKRPRINHIDTLSAKSAIEAKYIKDWVQKVEIIGNINYPSQAKQKKLSGTLILSVLVNHDGSVISSTVQQKSGEKLLDDAAIKVVKLASPYKQFPVEMREQYEQLMITRTWVYHSNNILSTQ
ncbi:MAG: energy transducer TonB [Gammaproteobacteria bacterium]|nr:energy transducer TonB [Gammaproteobacteria bacterium]